MDYSQCVCGKNIGTGGTGVHAEAANCIATRTFNSTQVLSMRIRGVTVREERGGNTNLQVAGSLSRT